jgi:cytochrome c
MFNAAERYAGRSSGQLSPKGQHAVREETLLRSAYYIYMYLDMYAKMHELREQGMLRDEDPPFREWRTSWIPDLMRSRTGRWMIENNLLDYYSAEVKEDIAKAARFSSTELRVFVEEAAERVREKGRSELAEFEKDNTHHLHGDTYLFAMDLEGKTLLQPRAPNLVGVNMLQAESRVKPILQRAWPDLMAGDKSHTWIFYRWQNPCDRREGSKVSYLSRHGDIVLGSGVYNLPVDEALKKDYVAVMAKRLSRQGATMTDVVGGKEEPQIFVTDEDGRLLTPSWNRDLGGLFSPLDLMKIKSKPDEVVEVGSQNVAYATLVRNGARKLIVGCRKG